MRYLEDQEQGEKTQAAYCSEQGISLAAFRYWKKRRSENHGPSERPLVEVPLRLTDANPGWLKVAFPNGCSLHVPAGWGIGSLVELAKALYQL